MYNTCIITKKTNPSFKAFALKVGLATMTMLSAISAEAVVMRHDTNPIEYQLDSSDYQSVIHSDSASATLIQKRWALTAAHAFDASQGHSQQEFGTLTIMGQSFAIKQVHIHPDYFLQGDEIRNDIALLELEESVEIITPTPVYEQQDELGQTAKLAGYGHTGNGVDGIIDECFPCDLHGADNVIFDANDDLLGLRFDAPNTTDALPLEGIGGPGDSGGPLYLETSQGRFVAGVSSHGGQLYDELEGYTRVSTHLDWIYEVMADDYTGSYSGPTYSENNAEVIKVEVKISEKKSSGGSWGIGFLLFASLMIVFRQKATR